jgi:hypothetical protein
MLDCTICKQTLPESEFNRATKEARGYAWWCKSCKSEKAKQYRRENPEMRERKRENLRRWRQNNKLRSAYLDQKNNAESRGIDFLFSFDEWVEWWGDDIERRGAIHSSTGRKVLRNRLVMARHGDVGPYSPSNTKKITCSENTAEQWLNLRRVGSAGQETRHTR